MGLSDNLIFDIRMKIHIFKSSILLVLLVLAGCQEKDELGKASNVSVSLRASIENTESRTSVDEEGCVLWVNTDAIGVFGNETRNAKFQSISSGTDVLFVGEMASRQDVPTLAYYPYNEHAVLDGNTLHFDLPSEYAYTGESNAPMLGIRQPDGSFVFKHLCGLLQVTVENVPEDAKCLNIVSEGTEGQEAPYIAGSVTINDVTAENATISIAKDGSRELSIGLENTSSQETCTFNIPVPLGDYPQLSVKPRMDDGSVSMDKTISDVSMARAKMLDMPAVDVEKENDVVKVTEAGTLQQLLGEDFLNLTSLKIVGPINGDDVNCLRQMLGGYEFTEIGQLSTIDLSGATIVEGGGWYYEDQSANPEQYYTSNNIVGEDMFYYCSNLQEMVLPTNVIAIENSAFSSCKSLISVDIPDGVTSLGSYVFQDCHSLSSVKIPDGITTIGTSFFYGCRSLQSIHIPNSVTSIRSFAFYDCHSLQSIQIPNGVTTIGERAFQSCHGFTTIDIPDKVTSIGSEAFRNCTSLRTITIGDGVTSIGNYAFLYCYSLTSVKIGKGVTSIGIWAFRDCTSLPSIEIPDNVISIGKCAFMGCAKLASAYIGKGVTSIGAEAFENCTSLMSIDIPDNVTSIGEYVFRECSSLTSITIGNGVTSIRKGTFDTCTSLASVTVGKGLTYIGYNAFQDCPSLSNFYCHATTPPDIETEYSSSSSFDSCYENATLHVPVECSPKYESSAWKNYFPNIKEMK